MNVDESNPSFGSDFRRFFTRGLAALLPTLITLYLLTLCWNFLWDYLGSNIIWLIKYAWLTLVQDGWLRFRSADYIGHYWDSEFYPIRTHIMGVGLAILLVYFVGVLVGNLLGRAAWGIIERGVIRIPLVRAIYPAVKQVTDFILEDHSPRLKGSRVVAVQPHESGIWSIGMITGQAVWPAMGPRPEEMVTVFVPSTPTVFTGYVLVVPRSRVVELPMTVEEALRLLVSGGVISPEARLLAPGEKSTENPPMARAG